MKIKQYFNSLVSRRKSSNKSSSHTSVSQTDCHYEICASNEPSATEHQSRTELLLNRHAQLVNTIINIRSQQQQTHSYANTLATSNPHRIYHTVTNRQRSKIRTNPWITTISSSPSHIEHSESFPQTIPNNENTDSQIIDSSSTDNINDHHQHKDVKRRKKKQQQQSSIHTSYQRSTNSKKRQHPIRPTSSDEYSQNFENILENQSKRGRSPFILPLDEIDMKTSRNYSGSLKKTNSHTILKHIEEIENEIQMIKNLNFNRTSIHEQIDQWVDQCLTNSKSNLPKQSEIMTAFYLSSIPTTKRTVSYIEQSIPIVNTQEINKNFKSTQECPF